MKQTFLMTALQIGAKRIPMGLGFALALTFPHLNATAQDVDLATANNYAVLANTAISAANPSVVNGGNVGLSPGAASSITGPISITAPYTIDTTDANALQAQKDLTTAYNVAAGLPVTATLTGVDLGTISTLQNPLAPGVYYFKTSAELTGTLYLNDGGKPDAVFVFQIGSTLTTASDSKVVTVDSGAPQGSIPGVSVFWQVGSSATLGTGTDFEGNILASAFITDDGGSTVDGRLLAETAAVTLNNTIINVPLPEYGAGSGGGNGGGGGGGGGGVPDTGSTLPLLGSGLAALFAFGRRFSVLLR